jgi:hypothetical protein
MIGANYPRLAVLIVLDHNLDGVLNGCQRNPFIHHIKVDERIHGKKGCVDVLLLSFDDGICHNGEALILTHYQLVLR